MIPTPLMNGLRVMDCRLRRRSVDSAPSARTDSLLDRWRPINARHGIYARSLQS
jgi:hypothetical protein